MFYLYLVLSAALIPVLNNFFEIFMPIVAYWALYDNNLQTNIIADSEEIFDKEMFNKIRNSYVGKR